jgi:hypothetical protein
MRFVGIDSDPKSVETARRRVESRRASTPLLDVRPA